MNFSLVEKFSVSLNDLEYMSSICLVYSIYFNYITYLKLGFKNIATSLFFFFFFFVA